jgi:periplasmic protein TonB
MLHAADSFVANDYPDTSELPLLKAEKSRLWSVTNTPDEALGLSASRYGDQRRLSPSALALTIMVHVLVLAVLLGVGQHVVQRKEAKLVSINLSPPPPPPAESASEPEPQKPAVSAPRPLIDITPPQAAPIPVAVDPKPAPPAAEPVKPSVASSAPSSGAPSVIQGGDLGARMVSGKPPRYPVESRRKKEQGTVVLSLILGLNGAVEHITVSRSSGFERLDDAALSAVRRWRWEPVLRGGLPVKVRGVVEIPFVLQG